ARLRAAAGEVAATDAQGFLRGAPQPFDLVFLDPPFAQDLWSALAARLEQGGWLADRAWIYVESPRGQAPTMPANWSLHREGQAGEVRYALYRRGPAGAGQVPGDRPRAGLAPPAAC
ncbi:MAG TPA: RsmD family RNA methyltransferase, partial [Rhodanobacter sp.]